MMAPLYLVLASMRAALLDVLLLIFLLFILILLLLLRIENGHLIILIR